MSEWTARQVAGHLIDGYDQVRALLRHDPAPTSITDPGVLAQLAGRHPAAALDAIAAAVVADIADLDPTAVVLTPRGHLTVEQAMTIALIEPVIHAWDLGQALGRPVPLDPEATHILLAGVTQLGNQLAATGMYAPAWPSTAAEPDDHRLLAAVGRRPA